MATYPAVVLTANQKTPIPAPDADAFIIGNGAWFLSDDDSDNRGIMIPANTPYKIAAGVDKYGFCTYPTILTMADI